MLRRTRSSQSVSLRSLARLVGRRILESDKAIESCVEVFALMGRNLRLPIYNIADGDLEKKSNRVGARDLSLRAKRSNPTREIVGFPEGTNRRKRGLLRFARNDRVAT